MTAPKNIISEKRLSQTHMVEGNLKVACAHKKLLLATVIAGLTHTNLAWSDSRLEEVIVTAQKRAQSVQDVPISVTSINGDRVETAGIKNLESLSEHVPAMHITRSPSATAIRMRGIGSTVNKGFEQSVGMYVDGVYFGRGRQYRANFFDLDRVEVLRGPQSTLFGKNTVAGALSITSRSPVAGEEFSGDVIGRYEWEYDSMEVSGGVTFPLGESAAFRLSGKYYESDGYYEYSHNGSPSHEPEDLSIRGTLVWDITDSLALNLKLGRFESENTGVVTGVHEYKFISDDLPGLVAYEISNLLEPSLLQGPREHTLYSGPYSWINSKGQLITSQWSDEEHDSAIANLNWEINDNWLLTSISSYTAYEFEEYLDADFIPARFLGREFDDDFEQYSQELRFTYNGNGSINAIAGLYYDKQELTNNNGLNVDSSYGGMLGELTPYNSLFEALLGPVYPAFPTTEIFNTGEFKQETESYAVFGEVSYEGIEDWLFTIGLRYSKEDKEANATTLFYSDITGGNTVPSDNPILAALWAGLFGISQHSIRDDRSVDNINPSLKVQWYMSDDTMFYVNASTGFKSGGFTASEQVVVLPDGSAPDFEFDDEELASVEFGVKSEFLDGRARVNAAAYHMQYDDVQVSSFDGLAFVVSNAAEAEISGFEVDANWLATEKLTLGLSTAYLDYEWKDFDSAACTQQQTVDHEPSFPGDRCVQDLSGRTNSFSPEWSGSLTANYVHPLTPNMNLVVDADAYFTTEYYTSSDLDEENLQKGYEKYNLRVALEREDGTWWVAAYGKNIGDEVTLNYGLSVALITGSKAGVQSVGEVYGIDLGYRF